MDARPALSPAANSSKAPAQPPRLLYVVSEDWYFLAHRLPMARAARDAGFDVHVATRAADCAAAIAAEQFTLHPIPFARGRLSPFASMQTVLAIRRVHRAVRPHLLHHVSLQPIVLGLVAAMDNPVPTVNAITGLGYSFTSRTARALIVRRAIRAALRLLLARNGAICMVQNSDDFEVLMSLGVPRSRIVLIQGSGVDVNRLLPLAEPDGAPTVAFVGRLLADKGIRTLLDAHRLLRAHGSDVRLLIAGSPDPANATSVTAEEASTWSAEPGVTWLGHVREISKVWRCAHIAALPSRGGEGVPLSLLEAAACGRAMVASDVTGCREIVIAGKSGLLVPVDDAPALAGAISRLADEPKLRMQFAAEARKLVVAQFSADIVGRQTLELYRNLLARRQPSLL